MVEKLKKKIQKDPAEAYKYMLHTVTTIMIALILFVLQQLYATSKENNIAIKKQSDVTQHLIKRDIELYGHMQILANDVKANSRDIIDLTKSNKETCSRLSVAERKILKIELSK